MATNDFPVFTLLYPEIKFWLAVGGFFFGIFRGIDWIKKIKTNDLHHIQIGVDDLKVEMKDGFTSQTAAIVGELQQTREEMRTYFAPMRRRTASRRRARK